MKKLRICYIVEWTTDVRMANGLAERADLTILGRNAQLINHQPTAPLRIKTSPRTRAGFARYILQHLLQTRGEYDRVIVQGYGLAALAANLACRWIGVPAYMLVCSPIEAYYLCREKYTQPDKPFRKLELASLYIVARMNALVGQHYIALSEHLEQVIRKHRRGVSVFVVPVYGVDTGIFSPSVQQKEHIRADLGLPKEGELIFFSSRIAPEKDSQTLLTAFRALRERGRDIWLLNRSGAYKAIIAEAELLNIADRLIATGAAHPHQDLPLSYQASDICVQASREEGLGFSPLEALACGIPVVAASVGGLRETIVDGETGWTYPPGDWEALARQIEAVLDDPDEASRRTVAGRKLVQTKYESSAAFDRLAAILGQP